MNCKEIGAVIALLHDTADITTPACKGLGETKFKKSTIVVFITNMIVWAYTRNIVFPWIIYNILFNISDDFNGEPLMRPYFCFFLSSTGKKKIVWYSKISLRSTSHKYGLKILNASSGDIGNFILFDVAVLSCSWRQDDILESMSFWFLVVAGTRVEFKA